MDTDPAARPIARLVTGLETRDGAGVRLVRYIGTPDLDQFDPFLLLDEFRSDDPDDYIRGFPPHPHRGFETVTYLLHGRVRHRDSAGHQGVVEAGGVQWMTAGRGIEHSEMPEQDRGLLHGFQLWVNLPAAQKMRPPRYQEFPAAAIPEQVDANGARVRVIAGVTDAGTRGPVVEVAADPLYLDVTLPAAAHWRQHLHAGDKAFLFVIDGSLADRAGNVAGAGELAVLGAGDRVELASEAGARSLLVAGRPFREPVARHGPFVMNTEAEIRQAIEDYRSGRLHAP